MVITVERLDMPSASTAPRRVSSEPNLFSLRSKRWTILAIIESSWVLKFLLSLRAREFPRKSDYELGTWEEVRPRTSYTYSSPQTDAVWPLFPRRIPYLLSDFILTDLIPTLEPPASILKSVRIKSVRIMSVRIKSVRMNFDQIFESNSNFRVVQ